MSKVSFIAAVFFKLVGSTSFTLSDVKGEYGISVRTMQRILSKLRQEGYIERSSSGLWAKTYSEGPRVIALNKEYFNPDGEHIRALSGKLKPHLQEYLSSKTRGVKDRG